MLAILILSTSKGVLCSKRIPAALLSLRWSLFSWLGGTDIPDGNHLIFGGF